MSVLYIAANWIGAQQIVLFNSNKYVVVIHVQCLVSVYLSLVKIKYSVCVWKKKIKNKKTNKKKKNKNLFYFWYRPETSRIWGKTGPSFSPVHHP